MRLEAVQPCCCLIQLIRGRPKEDPASEAAASAAVVLGKGEELRPGHACRHGQGAEYVQHVGRLFGKVVGVALLAS
jgi:hypothetical protein